MDILNTKIKDIKTEKSLKIRPENIKSGVTILGITGNYEGTNRALSFNNYSAMVTAFNSLAEDVYTAGQSVMIVTSGVPDLWVSSIESTSVPYTYTTDAAIMTALETNGYIQVGYYKLSALEVDLTNLVAKSSFAYDDTTETLTITIS